MFDEIKYCSFPVSVPVCHCWRTFHEKRGIKEMMKNDDRDGKNREVHMNTQRSDAVNQTQRRTL